jgi:HSP20 family molecular chaperone IbpA
MTYSVKPTADFKTVSDPQADHTVLLKLREGDEYKLVLNMQNYRPENIVVKLNDEREISVTALAGDKSEDFMQRHTVPEGIDTEKMSSSFSADGILVIKAPRKK